MANNPTNPNSTCAAVIQHPQRLQALCELWCGSQQDVWLTLQGGSMMPTIRAGSRLRLRCHQYVPVLGDVIAFRRGTQLIVHRLQSVDAQGRLICQGDANAAPDVPITLSEVVGLIVETQAPAFPARLHRGGVRVKRVLSRIRALLFARRTDE